MMIIKEIRMKKGITQRKAAADLGLSPVVYGRYENGIRKPEPDMLAAIADYYGVTVDTLLGRINEPPDEKELDKELSKLLADLDPEEQQRVRDFVQGLKAARKA